MISTTVIRSGRRYGGMTCTVSAEQWHRRGVVYMAVSVLVLISGSILALLGFLDVFGAELIFIGLLLVAISVLLFIFAIRKFLIAAKMKQREGHLQTSRVAAMVIEQGDDIGTLTVVMDAVHGRCSARYSEEDCQPPDYSEATSDFYAGSTCDSLHENGDDPPPKYGPPSYTEALAHPVIQAENIDKHTNSDSCCSARASTPSTPPTSSLQDQEPAHGASPEPGQRESTGYQDLPNVTI